MKASFVGTTLIYVLLIIIMMWNRGFFRSDARANEEAFSQCVYRPKHKQIYSVNTNVGIPRSRSAYELSLIEFATLIERADLRRRMFLRKLNRLPEIDAERPFKVVYEVDDDMLVYRDPAFHGFHIRFDSFDRPSVVGVVNHYDVVALYTTPSDKE